MCSWLRYKGSGWKSAGLRERERESKSNFTSSINLTWLQWADGRLISWNIKFKCGSKKGRTLPRKEGSRRPVLAARLCWNKQNRPSQHPGCCSHTFRGQCLAKSDESSPPLHQNANRHTAAVKTGTNRSWRWRRPVRNIKIKKHVDNTDLIVRQWHAQARTTNIKAEVTSECSIYISAEQLCQLQDYRQAIDFQAQGQYLYTQLQAVNSAVLHYKMTNIWSKKKKKNNLRFHGC